MGVLSQENRSRLLLVTGGVSLGFAVLDVLLGNTSTALVPLVLGLIPIIMAIARTQVSSYDDSTTSENEVVTIDRQRTATYVASLPSGLIAYCLGLGVVCLAGGLTGVWALLTGRVKSPIAIIVASAGGLYLGIVCLAGVAKVWIISRRE